MKALSIVCAVAALLVCAAIPLKSFAEDDAKMSAAQIAAGQTKAGVANTLIVIGRSAKDPDMLMAAARLLASIDAPVADPEGERWTASRCSTTSTPSWLKRTAMPPIAAPSRPRATMPASATTNIGATA